jgi:hypothetical protein
MTKRQKIASEFVRLLSAITVGTYKTTFPTVTHWSVLVEPKEDEKFVTVKDRTDSYLETQEGLVQVLTLDVQLACCKAKNSTDSNYTIITNMIDDVLKCIYTNLRTLQTSLNIIDIVPVSAEPDIDQFEREVGAGKVTFRITHHSHAIWLYDSTTY